MYEASFRGAIYGVRSEIVRRASPNGCGILRHPAFLGERLDKKARGWCSTGRSALGEAASMGRLGSPCRVP